LQPRQQVWLGAQTPFAFRCHNKTRRNIINNVFSNAFDGNGSVGLAYNTSSEPLTFRCNRYENGNLVEETIGKRDRVSGGSHDTSNCPSFRISYQAATADLLVCKSTQAAISFSSGHGQWNVYTSH
jgi:hypothetical protein